MLLPPVMFRRRDIASASLASEGAKRTSDVFVVSSFQEDRFRVAFSEGTSFLRFLFWDFVDS